MRDQIGTDKNELVLIIGSCTLSDISETTPNKSIGFQGVCIWAVVFGLPKDLE